MGDSNPKTLVVCRLCLGVTTRRLYPAKSLQICFVSVLPTLDLNLTQNPGLCIDCVQNLTQSYNFKVRCLSSEDRISKYHRTVNESVDLYDLLKDETIVKTENIEIVSQVTHNESIQSEKAVFLGLNAEHIAQISDLEDVNNSELKIEFSKDEVISIGNSDIEDHLVDDKEDTDSEFIEECSHSSKERIELCKNTNNSTAGLLDINQVVFNYTEDLEYLLETRKFNTPCSSKQHASTLEQNENETPNGALQSPISKQRKVWKRINDNLFQCVICNKYCKQRIHLDGHLLTKHKNIPNIESSIKSRLHHCIHCQYRTINSHILALHMLSKHGIMSGNSKEKLRTWECAHCGYTTQRHSNFRNHLKGHGALGAFRCQYCKSCFTWKYELSKHYSLVHKAKVTETNSIKCLGTGRQIYQCNICELKFMDKSKYNSHLRRHVRKRSR